MNMKKLILIILMATAWYSMSESKPLNLSPPIEKRIIFNPDTAIVDSLTAHGYTKRHAEYWARVARMESGDYKSVLYTYHNNPWGMAYFKNGKRPTNGLYRVYHNGKPTRFAGFKTKQHAIQEIIFYLDAAGYPKDFKSIEEFIKFMKKKNYFEEPVSYYYRAILNV